jgi:hypothetical protein
MADQRKQKSGISGQRSAVSIQLLETIKTNKLLIITSNLELQGIL